MTTKFFKFENGDLLKDKITGFKGICTGSVAYLTGCNQYLISSKSKDGNSEGTAIWYDEGRLALLEQKVFKPEEVKAVENGADKQAPVK